MRISRHAPLLCALLLGCGPAVPKVPAGFTPLEATNPAPFPAAVDGDQYPETFGTIVSGFDEQQNYEYADAQGYIQTSLLQVWKAIQNPDALVQHRLLNTCQIASLNTYPNADFSFVVNLSSSIDQFTMVGRDLATVGSESDPKTVVFREDLQSMTDFNELDSDSVVLQYVNADVTSYSVLREERNDVVGVPYTTPEDVATYISDIFANVVAAAHGNPIPDDSDSPCMGD